jgi:hypothetical protein
MMVSGGASVNKFAIHLDVVARDGLRAEVSAGFTVDVTWPAAINSSQWRRDPIPAAARKRFKRIKRA